MTYAPQENLNMDKRYRIAGVIPHYRHPKSIEYVVASIAPAVDHIYVVDDASGEDSEAVLQRLETLADVTVVRRAINGGKGAAVSSGCIAAQQGGFSHVFQVDADAQHDLARAKDFIDESRDQPLSVICGYPKYDESVPKARLWGRYLTHVFVWLNSLSFAIKDSMCGFRVYPLQSLIPILEAKKLHLRMGFDIEILVRLHWQGVRFCNKEVAVYYPMDGVSHFDGIKDNLEISSTHTRLFLGMVKRAPLLMARWFK